LSVDYSVLDPQSYRRILVTEEITGGSGFELTI
jgi:hypothetical protein